ncbi:MAG: hypothetical protein ACI9MC_002668 [Kiritimatiellia bacterium]|jgi:hypothetical protein
MHRALLLFFGMVGCVGVGGDVTYYEDVRPILQDQCVRCHNGQGLGVGNFNDPDVVLAFAERIKVRTQERTMPLAVADPTCRPYVGADHMTLDRQQRNVLARWVDQGALLGDSADAIDGTQFESRLENPDMELRIPEYTPTFDDPGNPGNEYRCFALDPGHHEDFFVTALDALIDEQRLVHHVVVGAVPRDSLRPDAFDPEGMDCIDDDMGAVENMLAAWAPGSQPQIFEQGAGMRIAKDEVLMVQMHYYLSGPDTMGLSDRSGYAMRTASSVQTELEVLTLGSVNFRIPADDPAYIFEEAYQSSRNLRIHGVFPHMHVLGAGYSLQVDDRKDGCLVQSDIYDFHNQLTYLFEEPMTVAAGETLSWSCTWNNSTSNPDRLYSPPRETLYGERTDEEMCFFFTVVEVD